MNIKFVKNFNQICPERPTLFCFPFAGGGASAYNSWIQKMQGKITVCPIQLPGREERIMEKPYSNMVDMLDELEENIWEALGGATEASIWSNCYEIPDVIPENWKSIPYGKPLANQKYYILDQNMENCPNWVPGNLYIAGEGIALGYLNDEEKTKEKFIIWEKTGEKLYSTGDMGRYWSDGNIEFLGRVDNQIKINGYRVEIGEIENALYATSLVKKCMVSYEKDKLCAYIIKETERVHWEIYF